jgi:hypothetical protein
MREVKILLKDNDKPGNRDVIQYLSENIDKFNKVGIKVLFKIVAEDEIPSLVNRGVTKLPVLAVGKKLYEKSSEIKNTMNTMYAFNSKNGGSSKNPSKCSSQDPDEQLREYMESDLNKNAMEEEKKSGSAEDGSDVMDKVLAMASQRTKERQDDANNRNPAKNKDVLNKKARNGNSNKVSESAVERINRQGKSGGSSDRDDQLLMARFEESGIVNDF